MEDSGKHKSMRSSKVLKTAPEGQWITHNTVYTVLKLNNAAVETFFLQQVNVKKMPKLQGLRKTHLVWRVWVQEHEVVEGVEDRAGRLVDDAQDDR